MHDCIPVTNDCLPSGSVGLAATSIAWMFASHANQLTILDLQAQIEKLEDPFDKVAALTGIAHRQHHGTSPRPLKPAR